MKTLQVALGERAYAIHIGAGLVGDPQWIQPHLAGQQALVVTNDTVAPLYLDRVLGSLAGIRHHHVILPDGERFKTLDTVNLVFDKLLSERHDRHTTLIALGGGVVGDITGFAAACYQRGVAFIQIPTTLLAQVDSSVGGKTGVNHPLGKNMIGAFHQPRVVVADTDTLDTLDERQLRAGLAEVIKYGLIGDRDFFAWLERHMDALLEREPTLMSEAIARSCQNKADVVAADEREAGRRALLNLGHTFGHAIETGMGYGAWLHGEAVAAGMMAAARMSVHLGLMPAAAAERTEALLRRAGLPVSVPESLPATRALELMAVDKKVQDGRLRLVLLRDIGEAVVTADFSARDISATWEDSTTGVAPSAVTVGGS